MIRLSGGNAPSGYAEIVTTIRTDRAHAEELDAADPLAGFRARFVCDDKSLIYLDGNSLGPLPIATEARIAEVVRQEWGGGLVRSWASWIELPRRAWDLIGRNLIITDDDNFPTDRYVLAGIAAQHGCELRMIATGLNDGVSEDAVRAAVDGRTALVSLSHVAYRSGALADMAAITGIAHEAGALMLWDLCHSVGAVPVELDACDADLAVGCTYKYLNAGPGAPAFLYVSARLREVLRQPIWGWFSQRDQFAMGPRYDPAAGIAKFMTGTPSILGTAAVEEGVK